MYKSLTYLDNSFFKGKKVLRRINGNNLIDFGLEEVNRLGTPIIVRTPYYFENFDMPFD